MECKEGEKMNIFGVISKYDNSGRLQDGLDVLI